MRGFEKKIAQKFYILFINPSENNEFKVEFKPTLTLCTLHIRLSCRHAVASRMSEKR